MRLVAVSSALLLVLAAPGDHHIVLHAQSPAAAGFTDSVVFTGLTLPTAIAFSPDGSRVRR